MGYALMLCFFDLAVSVVTWAGFIYAIFIIFTYQGCWKLHFFKTFCTEKVIYDSQTDLNPSFFFSSWTDRLPVHIYAERVVVPIGEAFTLAKYTRTSLLTFHCNARDFFLRLLHNLLNWNQVLLEKAFYFITIVE